MQYKPTIGLEIHAELNTQTKMFCDCLNDPEEKHPNVNICPVCTGHPGNLPVPNKQAIESVLKVGMALNGDIPQFSKFDRKNYFYPDLPKSYQISQYDLPFIFGGMLQGVRLRRIHLEEDTGSLAHSEDGKSSYVDYNRSSVPLMELVTEPDITSAEQAVLFAKELQLILRYLGVSDADMEKGQMRVEANISIAEVGLRQSGGLSGRTDSNESVLGTKVEVKNINSFKAVQGAIEYELKRQEELIKSGGKVIQETRGWDDAKRSTFSQRIKEEAHDYRYFPEPDIPPLDMSAFDLKKLKLEIPELPHAKRLRFVKEYGLLPEQAELLVINRDGAQFFEETISELAEEEGGANPEAIKLAFNYLTSDLWGQLSEKEISLAECKVDPENFADLIVLIYKKEISSRAAKDILAKMLETGLDPREIMKSENLAQVSDEFSLRPLAEKIVSENPKAVEDFKKGKSNALQFLVGKAMAALKGGGNPTVLQKIFSDVLAGK
ncbi:MAG: Asp-tRNA(Asn)/Glu-tRNA(Gln) amidotransferase subunit GatB [bacterium]|nr:Asp-tRNA(Asn)/Glu-tRNA(Gln) amidotransferase subunit GatB [bacterium]